MVDLFPFTNVDWPYKSYHVSINGIWSPHHKRNQHNIYILLLKHRSKNLSFSTISLLTIYTHLALKTVSFTHERYPVTSLAMKLAQ